MKKIFKEAHKMTREMVQKYEVDYQAQFGLCLAYLLENKEERKMKLESVKELENMINNKDLHYKVRITTKKWNKDNKNRLYINANLADRRRGIVSFINLDNNEVTTKDRDGHQDWITKYVDVVNEIVNEYKEDIIKLTGYNNEIKKEKGETNTDLTAEYFGISNNISNEDFEDITGMKRFDESYF